MDRYVTSASRGAHVVDLSDEQHRCLVSHTSHQARGCNSFNDSLGAIAGNYRSGWKLHRAFQNLGVKNGLPANRAKLHDTLGLVLGGHPKQV